MRALVDHLPALVAYWDRDGRNVLANHAYVEWFGLTPEQLRGRHISEVLGERVYTLNLPHISAALAGERQDFERTLVDSFGRTRHTQASYVPEAVDGEVLGFFVQITDVTAKVEAERDLDEAQMVAGVASWSWVPGEELASWSPQLYRLAGVDPEGVEPTIESGLRLVHPEDREMLRASLGETTHEPQDRELRYRIVQPDGEVRHLVSRLRVERAPDGTVSRLRGTMLDETSTQNAHVEVARVNDELLRANRLLSDTMGMLGHDIRQPLAVTLGYLEHLRGHVAATEPEVLEQRLDRVHAAARRIRRLLDDVLSMATLDSGHLKVGVATVRVDELFADVVSELGEVDTTLLAVAADSEPGLEVASDPFHLRQSVVNLAVNATRYGEPPLELSARGLDGHVELMVRDAGAGVPDDLLPRLFTRFARGENQSARSTGSTGFGLYLVRQLVEANAGTVGYRPVAPTGACFTITLPSASQPAQ
ncbi:PAS domain S-box-containing protein [Nocardioides psychrotolerans]|uniref:Sensor-like histidine kinase SenX3 n=1 Tax=Nocardioides psychrotolerans TaxID=1005945 RepID=A0A1I3BWL0_9ACTN|nr:PAS domain S-box-containing protein [Nocardioides psychrotolerans]